MSAPVIEGAVFSAMCLVACSRLLERARCETNPESMLLDAYAAHCVSQYAVCMTGPYLLELSEAFALACPDSGGDALAARMLDFLTDAALSQARHDIGRLRLDESYHNPGFVSSVVRAAHDVAVERCVKA